MTTDMKKIKLLINGVEKNILGQVIDQNFWCYIDKETYCFPIGELQQNANSPKRTKNTAKGNHLIVAPMPGKITKIFVKQGDVVKKSEPLLVMEAMKMEYTLKSDLDTQVEKVNVSLGDQVTLGHLLICLQPSKIES